MKGNIKVSMDESTGILVVYIDLNQWKPSEADLNKFACTEALNNWI